MKKKRLYRAVRQILQRSSLLSLKPGCPPNKPICRKNFRRSPHRFVPCSLITLLAAGPLQAEPALGPFEWMWPWQNPIGGRPVVNVPRDSRPVPADLDGDGDEDLAVGAGDGKLYYYRNDSSAEHLSFTPRIGTDNPFHDVNVESNVIPEWSNNAIPAFADLDADGDLDAVVGENAGNLHWLENTGSTEQPEFTLHTEENNLFAGIETGSSRAAPAFADLDADGDWDLFIGDSEGVLHYYRNTGSPAVPGPFIAVTGAEHPLPPGQQGEKIKPALADLDKDGDLDVVMGNPQGTLRYFENTGSSTLPDYTEQTGTANPFAGVDVDSDSAPALGDLDGDGDTDMLVGNSEGSLRWFDNIGSPQYPAFEEKYSSTFTYSILPEGQIVELSVADFTRDSARMVKTVSLSGASALFISVLDEAAYCCDTITIWNGGDFTSKDIPLNADGIGIQNDTITLELSGLGIDDMSPDEIIIRVSEAIAVPPTNPFAGRYIGYSSAPALADLDDDGDIDVLAGNYEGSLLWYENTRASSTPRLKKSIVVATLFDRFSTAGANIPALADLDGDSDTDILMGNSAGTLDWYENTGTPQAPVFEKSASPNPFAGVDAGSGSIPVTADLDGDGDTDVAVLNRTGSVHWLENIGTTQAPRFIPAHKPPPLPSLTEPLFGVNVGNNAVPVFADIDNDGDSDAIIGAADGSIYVYPNIGAPGAPQFADDLWADSPFVGIHNTNLSHNAAPAVADFNKDGKPEILLGNHRGRMDFYQNLGTLSKPAFSMMNFQESPFGRISFSIYNLNKAPVFVDIDNDGDLDAFVETDAGIFTGTKIDFYKNTGSPEVPLFVRDDNHLPTDAKQLPAFADVDGDGDVDAFSFIGGKKGDNFAFYENTGSPSNPLFESRIGTENPLAEIPGLAVLADMDNDGDLDAFDSREGRIVYMENIGSPTHASFVERTGPDNPLDNISAGSGEYVIGDMDGDGDQDALIKHKDNTLHYAQNVGGPSMPLLRSSPENPLRVSRPGFDESVPLIGSPAIADLDNDGDVELWVEHEGQLEYYLNRGETAGVTFSRFSATGIKNPFAEFTDMPFLLDLNGNRTPEALIAADNGISFYENSGTPATPQFTLLTGGANPLTDFSPLPLFGDLNADGTPDAALEQSDSSPTLWYENTGSFQAHWEGVKPTFRR
ncbi:MAG: VCBS repeat-containing protein [Gammaproteobacteria bacterium]|nr:VCBS repeat-containing protein [Gammaproteobacteria bacterium]